MWRKRTGCHFLTSAMEGTKDFIANASLDSHNMQEIVDWYMLITVTLKNLELNMSLVLDFNVSALSILEILFSVARRLTELQTKEQSSSG